MTAFENNYLRFESKIYGRSAEILQMQNCFESAFSGNNRLLLIGGPSGIGKSFLVNTFKSKLGEKSGVIFLSGKYDINQNNPPYATIIQAFTALINQWEYASNEKLAEIQEILTTKMGNQLNVLVELFPSLTRILNVKAEKYDTEPIEFKDRFNEIFLKFVDTLSLFEQKIVVFLDDLQWADLATVQFLKLWLAEGKPNNVMWIGAYRDNEVTTGDLLHTSGLLKKDATDITTITLKEFDEEIILEMYADVMPMEAERMKSFALIMYQLTAGNPFFVRESLRFVQEDEIVTYNPEKQLWRYDFSRLRPANGDPIAVDFIFRRIKVLNPETLEVLAVAAAIGQHFQMSMLGVICKKSEKELRVILDQSVKNRVIIPIDNNNTEQPAIFEFIHDKIQDAAYQTLSGKRREYIHYAIGQLHEGALGHAATERNIYDIVNHYNHSQTYFKTKSEQEKLVNLNCRAGAKAKLSGSFNEAIKFFEVAIKWMEKDNYNWEEAQFFDVYLQAGEAAYLKSDFVSSVMYFESALKYASCNFQRAKVHYNFLVMYNGVSDVDSAWESGMKTLAFLSVKIPKKINKLTVLKMFGKIKLILNKVDLDSILDREDMKDKEAEQTLLTLMELISSAWDKSPEILAYIVLKGFEILLKNGNSPIGYFGLAGYGALLGIGFGKLEEGWKYINLGGQLTEKYDSDIFHGRGNFAVYGTYSYLIKPISHNIEPLKDAYNFTKEAGDYSIAAYSSILLMENLHILGLPVSQLKQQASSYLNFFKRTGNFDYLTAQRGFMTALDLIAKGPTDAVLADIDEVSECVKRVSFRHIHYQWYVYYMDALMLIGDYEKAFQIQNEIVSQKYEALSAIEYHSIFLNTWVYAEKVKRNIEERKAKAYIKKRLKYAAKMEKINPDNFALMNAFFKALNAEIGRDFSSAVMHYEMAIKAAANYKFPQYEALFHQLAAKAYEQLNAANKVSEHQHLAQNLYIKREAHYLAEKVNTKTIMTIK